MQLVFAYSNFLLFFVGLVFLLKKPVRAFFSKEAQVFEDKVEAAKKEAEKNRVEYELVLKRFNALQAEKTQEFKKLESLLEVELKNLATQTEIQLEKLQQDAETKMSCELEKIKTTLREDFISLILEEIHNRSMQPSFGHAQSSYVSKSKKTISSGIASLVKVINS